MHPISMHLHLPPSHSTSPLSVPPQQVGWASAYDLPSRITGQQRLVPYGEDKPPVLPGLPSGLKDVLKEAVGIQ